MPKRILSGVVENNSQDKTVVVRVERRFIDPLLKKTVRRSKKYHAHDEENKTQIDYLFNKPHTMLCRS